MSSAAVAECLLLLFFRRVEAGMNEVLFVVFLVSIEAVHSIILFLHREIEKKSKILKDNQNKVPDEIN
ncbi:MAG: hypothetical protein ACYC5K_12425, partial [Saccharofermentanales bacterium]